MRGAPTMAAPAVHPAPDLGEGKQSVRSGPPDLRPPFPNAQVRRGLPESQHRSSCVHPAATDEGILSVQSTDEELTECDLGSQCSTQWSPTEGDADSQWSPTQEELDPQFAATEEGPQVVIPQQSSRLANIWNVLALRYFLITRKASFKLKHPATSPVASNSSSPLNYEYDYGAASTNYENGDQHLHITEFKPQDYEHFNLIDSKSLAQVDEMIQQHRTIEPGNTQNLDQLFSDDSAGLHSFLYDLFTSAGLIIDNWTCMDASKFTRQVANHCAMILIIANDLLCLMMKKLAEAECESFGQDLKDKYQMLCARRLVENITEAADSISKLKWPASHIYQMLVLYKAIGDILIGERSFATSRASSIDSSKSDEIVQQMRVNFKGIFHGIECTIQEKLNGAQHTVSQVGHPATKFLIESMKLFTLYSHTVQDTCIGHDCSSLGHHLSVVISFWAEQLDEHFLSCTGGRNYIFLLNNLTHFYEETAESLEELMPKSYPNNDIGNKLKELIETNTRKYLAECWGPVNDCVKLISGVKPRWSSLDAFTSQFSVVYMQQKNWVLQTQLKYKQRQIIKEFLVPHYDTFLKKLQKRLFSRIVILIKKLSAGQQAKYMSTEELKRTLDGMFESEHKN